MHLLAPRRKVAKRGKRHRKDDSRNQARGTGATRRMGTRLGHSRPKGREVRGAAAPRMPDPGGSADKDCNFSYCPKGGTALRTPSEGSHGEACKAVRRTRASGEAEAKQSAVKGAGFERKSLTQLSQQNQKSVNARD